LIAPPGLPAAAPLAERGSRLPRVAVGLLALAGAGVAGYLTWVHYQPARLACFISSGCETVQHSSYAELLGIPVALLGLVAYLVLFASAFARGFRVAAAALAVSLAGLAFAAWLVYVQGWILDAWCIWCVTSDLVLAALTAACAWRLAALRE
jgi:uncharacterized membrane protein